MPKTKTQKFVFGIMMAIAMVYGMEVYTSMLRAGGITGHTFIIPANEMVMLVVIVVLLETLIGGPLARYLASKIVDPHRHRPLIVILTISTCTVCCNWPQINFF